MARGSDRVRTAAIIGAVVVCACSLALFLLLDRTKPDADLSRDSGPAAQTRGPGAEGPAGDDTSGYFSQVIQPALEEPRVTLAVDVSPLPSAETAFSEQLPALLERAAKGDPVAACRLAFGINRCSGYLGRKRFVEQAFANLDRMSASGSADFAVEALARAQESIDMAGRFCSGVDVTGVPHADAGLQASLAGLTPNQKTMLAMMLADGQVRRIQSRPWSSQASDYMIPQFIADNTLEFLNAGFAARNPLAIEGLILLHSPSSILAAQGVMTRLPNHKKFAAYAALYRRLYGPLAMGTRVNQVLDTVLSSLPPDDVAEISADVEMEAQRWARAAGLARLPQGQLLPPVADVHDPVAACDR